MASLSALNKPILPFTPTIDTDHNPTVCCACGAGAIGIGAGFTNKANPDPMYLCRPCINGIGDFKKLHRLSHYELKALDEGVAAVGEFIESNGGITELAHYDELMQRMLVKAAWEGCARGVRKALSEAPF